jgi:teichuronic acid biosynthesis glycosyltransferase TuaG
MRMPDVSVITAAYNSAAHIERTVHSVAGQSLQALEHIIIDDGSTDDTPAIVANLARQFPHLRVIQQANRGAGAARNAGIAAARARYVAFLDSDDYWTELKLEAQIGFMADNDVPFSYGDYETIDADTGESLGRRETPVSVSHGQLLRGCPIGCLTAAFDQQALGKQYMSEVRRGQDWALWLKLTRAGIVARRYPGCHAVYRRSKDSLSSDKLKKLKDMYRIYAEQERLGPWRSTYYLTAFALSTLTRKY